MKTDYKVLQGDCRKTLKKLPEKSIHTCVTSPPYFGLRNYNDEEDQIGIEQSPEEYVQELVKVFREVKRVLADDGTLWLNLGDSYVSTPLDKSKMDGLKTKDLIGIPWRVAFALQQDGWYLRQDIIWDKPNPMPESVKDRCTKSHEYIFLLTKNPKYYYDYKVIREHSNRKGGKPQQIGPSKPKGTLRNDIGNVYVYDGFKNKRSVWTVNTKSYKGSHFATFPPDLIRPCILAGCPTGGTVLDPFGGSGTTAQVALENDRNAILCELSEEYIPLIENRVVVYDKPLEEFMS